MLKEAYNMSPRGSEGSSVGDKKAWRTEVVTRAFICSSELQVQYTLTKLGPSAKRTAQHSPHYCISQTLCLTRVGLVGGIGV